MKPEPIHGPMLSGAGTDGNTIAFNSRNIHSIAIGSGANEVHTPLENIRKDDLEKMSRVVVGILTNSCDLKVDEKRGIIPAQPVYRKELWNPYFKHKEHREKRSAQSLLWVYYTISKKSVTKQRTELGIRNSKKSLLPPELRNPNPES